MGIAPIQRKNMLSQPLNKMVFYTEFTSRKKPIKKYVRNFTQNFILNNNITLNTITMKKTLTLLAAFTFVVQLASAQEFEVGSNVINVGLGLGGYYGGYDTSTQSPVFSASYERGVWDVPGPGVVSLGGYLGYKKFTYDSNFNNADYSWSYTVIGARGAYHYTGFDIDNLDVYGGAMISMRIYNGDDFNDLNSRPGATAFVGGRWYFTDSIAGFAEAGYGAAFLTLGASFRF